MDATRQTHTSFSPSPSLPFCFLPTERNLSPFANQTVSAMPSFAFHPINRITRTISSPTTIASHHQTKVVSVVAATRSRNGNVYSSSHLTSEQLSQFSPSLELHHQHSSQAHSDFIAMPRFNPLNFISAGNSLPASYHPSESSKPPSPLSSSSTSSARDSLPFPSSFSRTSSYNGPPPSHYHPHKVYAIDPSNRAVTDLPPVSPMSSMYDPHSPEASADGSRASDADSRESARLSGSSGSDSLDGNVFLRPRSTLENRLQSNEVRGPVVNGNRPSRRQSRDLGPSVAFRRALFERPSSPMPKSNPSHFPARSRESVFAGIAARGKVVDAFVANQNADTTRADDPVLPAQGMPRVLSGKSLEMPRGKVEQLPVPRPVTPCQVPRPETPSRLPRPRVFINQSPSRSSVVDPVAVTLGSEKRHGEAEFVTREIPRPMTPSPGISRHSVEVAGTSAKVRPLQEDFYFSDEEHVEDDVSEYRSAQYSKGAPAPSEVFSYKVRRAVSALRSISFQSHNPDDIETAWGQANTTDSVREKNDAPAPSSRRRRACGRISSKNGVQEYECQSEADPRSMRSYHANFTTQGHRGIGSRDLRGVVGVPLRGDFGSRQRRSLWTGGKKDRQQAPQTKAAELLLSNGPSLLAASTDENDTSHALTTVPATEALEISDRARSDTKRCSVDKYVEFVHASAQREARNSSQSKILRSRIVNRMFRRRWN